MAFTAGNLKARVCVYVYMRECVCISIFCQLFKDEPPLPHHIILLIELNIVYILIPVIKTTTMVISLVYGEIPVTINRFKSRKLTEQVSRKTVLF